METQMNELTNQTQKKDSKGKAIAVSILFVLLAFAVQIVIAVISTFAAMIYILAVQGGTTQDYIALAMDGNFLSSVTSVATVATTLLFVIWYKLKYAKDFLHGGWEQLRPKLFQVRALLLILLSSIAINFTSILVVEVINALSPNTVSSYVEMMGVATDGNPIVVFFTLVVLAPIGEECLFRGLVFNRLRRSLPLVAALIIQSVLFGIYHANLVQGIFVITLGMVAGYAAYKLNSIIPAIMIHMLNNGLCYLTPLLPEAVSDSILGIVVIWVAAILATVLVWKCMEDKSDGLKE